MGSLTEMFFIKTPLKEPFLQRIEKEVNGGEFTPLNTRRVLSSNWSINTWIQRGENFFISLDNLSFFSSKNRCIRDLEKVLCLEVNVKKDVARDVARDARLELAMAYLKKINEQKKTIVAMGHAMTTEKAQPLSMPGMLPTLNKEQIASQLALHGVEVATFHKCAINYAKRSSALNNIIIAIDTISNITIISYLLYFSFQSIFTGGGASLEGMLLMHQHAWLGQLLFAPFKFLATVGMMIETIRIIKTYRASDKNFMDHARLGYCLTKVLIPGGFMVVTLSKPLTTWLATQLFGMSFLTAPYFMAISMFFSIMFTFFDLAGDIIRYRFEKDHNRLIAYRQALIKNSYKIGFSTVVTLTIWTLMVHPEALPAFIMLVVFIGLVLTSAWWARKSGSEKQAIKVKYGAGKKSYYPSTNRQGIFQPEKRTPFQEGQSNDDNQENFLELSESSLNSKLN